TAGLMERTRLPARKASAGAFYLFPFADLGLGRPPRSVSLVREASKGDGTPLYALLNGGICRRRAIFLEKQQVVPRSRGRQPGHLLDKAETAREHHAPRHLIGRIFRVASAPSNRLRARSRKPAR